MYNKITVDRSLFYIEQHQVDTFQSIARSLDDYSYLVKEVALCKEDAWIIAFNCWLLLLPNKHPIIQSVDKMFYYSSNFIIYNHIKEDFHFKKFKMNNPTPELIYLASLNLATGLNEWIMNIYEKNNLLPIIEQYKGKVYFDREYKTAEELQIFLENQSIFVKAAMKELTTNSLSKIIKRCFNDAYFLYEEKFINKEIDK